MPPALPASNLLAGVSFMIGAAMLFPMMNGVVKLLGAASYDVIQIVWARTLSHLIFVLALFMPARGIGLLRTRLPGPQIARSVLLLLSTLLFFAAVQYVPLAEASAIGFVTPFIVTMAAVPILGERLTVPRVLAVVVGFVGALVVIRPGSAVFHVASLVVIVSSACYALYQVYTRRVAGIDAPETSVVYSALVGTIVMSCLVPFFWTTPKSLVDTVMLASLGIFGGLGHYCVARALTYAAANVVSPFNYFQLLSSTAVGFVLFGQLPTIHTWIGAAIIVGCGLLIGWSESRRRT